MIVFYSYVAKTVKLFSVKLDLYCITLNVLIINSMMFMLSTFIVNFFLFLWTKITQGSSVSWLCHEGKTGCVFFLVQYLLLHFIYCYCVVFSVDWDTVLCFIFYLKCKSLPFFQIVILEVFCLDILFSLKIIWLCL